MHQERQTFHAVGDGAKNPPYLILADALPRLANNLPFTVNSLLAVPGAVLPTPDSGALSTYWVGEPEPPVAFEVCQPMRSDPKTPRQTPWAVRVCNDSAER